MYETQDDFRTITPVNGINCEELADKYNLPGQVPWWIVVADGFLTKESIINLRWFLSETDSLYWSFLLSTLSLADAREKLGELYLEVGGAL